MIKKPITIQLSTGLDARPVAQLVQVASQFNSEIYVEIGKKKVNAKSIMGMMTLGLDSGEEITLSATGEDEEAAMSSIEKYLSNQYKTGKKRRPDRRPIPVRRFFCRDYKLTERKKQGIMRSLNVLMSPEKQKRGIL